MPRLFGTDGVRGVANTELTNELAYRLGQLVIIINISVDGHVDFNISGTGCRLLYHAHECALADDHFAADFSSSEELAVLLDRTSHKRDFADRSCIGPLVIEVKSALGA